MIGTPACRAKEKHKSLRVTARATVLFRVIVTGRVEKDNMGWGGRKAQKKPNTCFSYSAGEHQDNNTQLAAVSLAKTLAVQEKAELEKRHFYATPGIVILPTTIPKILPSAPSGTYGVCCFLPWL